MSDKSRKSGSSCSDKQTLNKKKIHSGSHLTAKEPTKTLHSTKTKLVESTDHNVPKVDAQCLIVDSESDQLHHQPSSIPEIEERHKLSSTPEAAIPSPNLEEAITSSPLPTRSGSSLLRIKTQIRQAKAVEAEEATRRTSEAEDQIDSDNDSGDTNTSFDASSRSIGGSRMFLNELPRHANEILQRSKSELEKSGNLKREIRESVISGLYTLYEMVLKLSDSRMLHMLEANKQKLNVSKESERLTQRHARFMHETLGQYALLKECIDKLQKEAESMRMIMSYDLCTAITETKREVTTVRHEMSSTSCISDQIKTAEELRLLRKSAESPKHTAVKDLTGTSLTAELQEIRSAIDDIKSLKFGTSFSGSPTVSTEQEKGQEEQVRGISRELRQYIHEVKTQLQEDITGLRCQMTQISQEVSKFGKCPADSLITSVQASVEELRRETRELQDTTVESAAPIRMAIEGLRNEVRCQSTTDRVNVECHNVPSQGQRKPEKAFTPTQTDVKHYSLSRSYSDVVARPNFSIMVESADPRNTSDDIIKQVKSDINIIDLGIGISNIKKARNQKVLISCETEGDRKILHDKLKNTSNKLTVQKLPTKNPLLRFIGVALDLNNKKIEEAVLKQNGSLLNEISTTQTYIKVVRRVKGRTSSTNNIIVEVSPQVWSRLKDQRIRLGFQIVPAVDQSPLIQCYRCLGFSHCASDCRADTAICAYCAEPHDTRECYNKNEAPKCTNCINKKANGWACTHPAYSSECPEWQRWDRIARSLTSYC